MQFSTVQEHELTAYEHKNFLGEEEKWEKMDQVRRKIRNPDVLYNLYRAPIPFRASPVLSEYQSEYFSAE